MGGQVLTTSIELVAEPGHHLERIAELAVGVESPAEDAVVDGIRMPRDVRHQRDDRRLELVEDCLQLLGGQPRLSAIQERVIRSLLITQGVSDATAELNVSLQVRRKKLEIVVVARLLPDRPPCRAGGGDLGHQLRRKLACFVIVAAGYSNQARL